MSESIPEPWTDKELACLVYAILAGAEPNGLSEAQVKKRVRTARDALTEATFVRLAVAGEVSLRIVPGQPMQVRLASADHKAAVAKIMEEP